MKRIVRGDVDKAFATADHIREGEVKMGGQEHFYLETQASLAVPKEEDELEVFSSNQHAAEAQVIFSMACHARGIANDLELLFFL